MDGANMRGETSMARLQSGRVAFMTMRASQGPSLPGNMTKFSAIQTTSVRSLNWGISAAGTSWPTVMPRSSTISMLTSEPLS